MSEDKVKALIAKYVTAIAELKSRIRILEDDIRDKEYMLRMLRKLEK